jgi:hypothetical protein
MSPVVLLSSSFAPEQDITLPAAQLAHMPGICMLQVCQFSRQGDLVHQQGFGVLS